VRDTIQREPPDQQGFVVDSQQAMQLENALQLVSAAQSVKPAVTVQADCVPLFTSAPRQVWHAALTWLTIVAAQSVAVHVEAHGALVTQPHSLSS
jgi:hypothetical protein